MTKSVHVKETPAITIDPVSFVVKFGLNRWAQFAPITTYVFTICSPATNTWWIVRKRFSECYSFRQQLLKTPGLSKQVDALVQATTSLKFPRRKIQGDTDEIKAERTAALKLFVASLASMRAACTRLALASHPPEVLAQASDLYTHLTAFLEVPDLHAQEEVRLLITTSTLTARHHSTLGCEEDFNTECPICLEEMGVNELLQLQCGHSFHPKCVDDWTKTSQTCPICRTLSYDESYIVGCAVHMILHEHSDESLLYRLRRCSTVTEDVQRTPAILLQGPQLIQQHPITDTVCSVCLESLDSSPRQLLCGHAFHTSCIFGWLTSQSSCPVCRKTASHGYLTQVDGCGSGGQLRLV
ncbi:hypothetical protein LEN26_018687 [Aphanomyces euteiches]|nr:hypothetical protein LEN26_018687 [Aphanomyces euteiches]KAH9107358.1 hypothetical protein AeMF1_017299 [Aphanomyces euteiches]KAH9185874.1 hypothetical protein AeNC1_012150 [Aphanomyces euteiches]